MGRLRDIVIDKWSPVAHKAPMKDDVRGRVEATMNGWAPSAWTGEAHRRRLTSYIVLASYDQNVSRHFLETTDDKDRDERREYGDAGLVVDQILAHLLGESQEVVIPGADAYDADLDDQTAGDAGEADADRPTPEDLAANAEARGLSEAQEFLRTWADDVHLPLRMIDAERNAVGLGDGVYLLGWDGRRERPTCAVMDPGFYFPVEVDSLDSYDYPETVHFAWELPPEDFSDGKARVRRITYRLTTLMPIQDEFLAMTATTPEQVEASWILPEGTEWRERDGFREVVRQYPWDVDGDVSTRTCTVTDATWVIDDLKDAQRPENFDVDNAIIRWDDTREQFVRDMDLGIDFLPVVHVPNTPPGGDHYGQSSLSRVLQLLDDIQNADTDAQAASATTGSPIIGLSGSQTGGDNPLTGRRGQALDVKPGAVWRLGENGRMDVADTSPQLEATRAYVDHLLERLAVNARLPAAVLGMLKPSEVPSGFAMQLSFGPLTSMIRQMRLVRSVKYPLLLKMVYRLYQANEALPEGLPAITPRAEIQLGAFLPSDMQGVLTSVREAYAAKLISLETAVTMLVEVGFPINDIAAEIALIESRDYEGAALLADATGDVDAARARLGLDPIDPPAAPAPIIPTPGAPGGQ